MNTRKTEAQMGILNSHEWVTVAQEMGVWEELTREAEEAKHVTYSPQSTRDYGGNGVCITEPPGIRECLVGLCCLFTTGN